MMGAPCNTLFMRCLEYLADSEYYVKYDFVLVPDCTKHFINVLNTERAKRGKNYVAPYKLPVRFALTFLVLACF